MTKKTLIILLSILLLCAVSCNDDKAGQRTSLCIEFQSQDSRTIMPEKALMQVQKYSVSGSGPGGAKFGPVLSTDKTVTINDLALGTWTIEAKALNIENNELASGSTNVNVKKGRNNAVMHLDTASGTGTLELDFTWDKNITGFVEMIINLDIEDSFGRVTQKTKKVRTDSESASVLMNLQAGSYVLNVTVSDSLGNLDVGATEAIRIVSNTRSRGLVTLVKAPLSGGGTSQGEAEESASLSLSIENKVGSPMVFYIDYSPKNPVRGQVMTLQSRASSIASYIDTSTLTYQWYKDGVLQRNANQSSYAIVTEGGIHRYDVVVKSDTLGSMCSATACINIPYL